MKHSGNSTGIFCSIFIFLFAAFTTKGAGIADSLYALGDYNKAAIEYEYLYFISADNSQKATFLVKKAACYSKLKKHDKASETLGRIDYSGLTDSLQYEIRKTHAFTSYFAGDFEKAESQILLSETVAKDSSLIVSLLPLSALVSNEMTRWEEAHRKLIVYVNAAFTDVMRDSLLYVISDLYSEKNIPKLKNLKKAQTMSAFLPGLGQAYTGYYLDGATSAFLVLGSVAVTVYGVVTAHYITAAVIGYGLMSKFYQGGIKHLEYMVGKTNYERSKVFNDAARKVIAEFAGK